MQFYNNKGDKMKGNLFLNERNQPKMTNSVMLKNDIRGMQTYRPGGGNKTIRQGQSMRFSPSGLSSHIRKSNYSPPKRATNFTHLPFLEDELRR